MYVLISISRISFSSETSNSDPSFLVENYESDTYIHTCRYTHKDVCARGEILPTIWTHLTGERQRINQDLWKKIIPILPDSVSWFCPTCFSCKNHFSLSVVYTLFVVFMIVNCIAWTRNHECKNKQTNKKLSASEEDS